MTTKLNERAMLVRLKIHMIGTSRTDRQVTDETIERKGAKRDSGRWTTQFIPKEAMKNIDSARNRLRTLHDFFTLPWLGDGTRVLPTQLFDKYMERYDRAVKDWQEAVDEFMHSYVQDTIIKELQKKMSEVSKSKEFQDYLTKAIMDGLTVKIPKQVKEMYVAW